ncbi:hypothetical protein BABINDRAFT_67607 [Babjeviella inositovora NRRL Y-12698]|uniref:HTH La-type RNA-binding domain-containing protein n=1 Tax=Babjeviella inositovora NRRL Y-12698 TaxID=984486 RepID=A0A1E3QHP7_9ASCO|nr:uncharacterized protein BABINDRAFT_67607 [Babjeviella inositovora NRRL Y-12698]ODQ77160.1 hypothetical protein BABINDRAFT_67607 [Babjeviella inositovora NRRL Y-12698]
MFNPYNAYAFPPPNGQFPVIDERLGYVTNQLRYYFSLENLLKDMYLRKNMDSEGYVLLGVINDFHRMKSLSGGALVVLQEAVKYVPELEMVWDREEDGILVGAKIRLREQWENWVIPS